MAPTGAGVARDLSLARRIAFISVTANLVLSLANIGVGLAAGSRSAVAAGVEFGADAVAALLVYAGLLIATRPPDRDHPYGHGRAEILTGLILGVLLVATGLGIAAQSLRDLGLDRALPHAVALWPLILAGGVKAVLMAVKFRHGRRIHSAALVADAWNDSVDILSAVAAGAGLGLTLYDPSRFLAADHFGAIVIGVVVVGTGLRVVRDTSLELMDTMPPPDVIRAVRASSHRVAGVRGVEKCWGRKTGLRYHVDLHLEVDPLMTVAQAHDIAEQVRQQIRRDVREVADVLIHIEPAPAPVSKIS